MIVAGHQTLSTDLKLMGLQMRKWISRLMRGENTLIYPSIPSPLSLPLSSCLLLSLSRVPPIPLHPPPATVLMTIKHFPLHILPDLEVQKASQQKEAVKGAKSSVSSSFLLSSLILLLPNPLLHPCLLNTVRLLQPFRLQWGTNIRGLLELGFVLFIEPRRFKVFRHFKKCIYYHFLQIILAKSSPALVLKLLPQGD